MPDHLHPAVPERRPGRRRPGHPWRLPVALLAGVAVASAAAPTAAVAATDQAVADARSRAVAWIGGQQQANGSFGAPGGLDPAWALIGLAGDGRHAADLRVGAGSSAQDHYAALWGAGDDSAWSSSPSPIQATDYARAILIGRAAGIDPARLGAEQNLVAKLAGYWRNGYFQTRTALLNQTIFGLLALEQVDGVPAAFVEQVAGSIEAAQLQDGGYGFVTAESAPSVPGDPRPVDVATVDVDFTGAVIAALCGAGRTIDDPSVSRAIARLRQLRIASGAVVKLGTIGSVDSNAWVLQGLGACGVTRGSAAWSAGGWEQTLDWLLQVQRADGAWAVYPEMATNPPGGVQPGNTYATQDALRAIVDAPGFAADSPARANPADPRWRPVPPVAAGTPISVALAVDAGFGELRLCRVETVQGATLRELLQTARDGATPTDCVAGPRWDGGVLSVLNGRRTASSSGGWRWSVDGGVTEAAASDGVAVSAGQVVSLRLVDPSSEVVLPDPDPPVVDPDPPVDPPVLVPDPPYVPPGVPTPPLQPTPPQQPTAPTKPRTPVTRTTVRTSCRRTSRNRVVRCTVRASGRFTVAVNLPGRKVVRKTSRTRVVTVVRSPRAVKRTQRIRLRITVGKRSRVITVRANGRTTVSRV